MDNKRRTLVICIISALLVICSGTVVLCFMWAGDAATTLEKQIQTADMYYAKGDYEHAVIAYQAAIEEDKTDEKPYQRLTMIYLSQNEMTLAQNVLSMGITNTSSPRLIEMWKVYFGDDVQVAQGEETEDSKETVAEMTVNWRLLSEIAAATYHDCQIKYGEPSISQKDQVCTVTYGKTGISYRYYNTSDNSNVVDQTLGRPYDMAKAKEVSLDNLSLLFGGMEDSLDYQTLSQLDVRKLKKGYDKQLKRYVVSFLCGSCNVMVESDENGNITSCNAWNKITPAQADEEEKEFPVEAQVLDATTGAGVLGAIVNVRAEDDQTGEILAQTETDADGFCEVDLLSGYYLAEIKMEGYITEYFEIYVDPVGDTENLQFVISPTVESGQIRIVLEWGSSPADLDSHLEGTLSDGTGVNIYFANQTLSKNGEDLVSLDVDDTRGYGPETTTINDSGGNYHFYVLDYRQEGTLGINGATVKVYMPGEKAPVVIEAPSDVVNVWDVLNIDAGVLTVNNRAGESDTEQGAK